MIYLATRTARPASSAPAYLEDLLRGIPTRARTSTDSRKFFRQFSFPGGIGDRTPETPARSTRSEKLDGLEQMPVGAAFDNPNDRRRDRWRRRIRNRPLATSCAYQQFSPAADGAVLPIFHLNGYKINHPTVLARIPHELESLRGLWLDALLRRRLRSRSMVQAMAVTVEHCVIEIKRIQKKPSARGRQ